MTKIRNLLIPVFFTLALASCGTSEDVIYITEEVLVYEEPKTYAPIQSLEETQANAGYREQELIEEIKQAATIEYHGQEISQRNLIENTMYKAKLELNDICDFIDDGNLVDDIEDGIDWNLSHIRKKFKPLQSVRRSQINDLEDLAEELAETMADEYGCDSSRNMEAVMALADSVESDNQALKMLSGL